MRSKILALAAAVAAGAFASQAGAAPIGKVDGIATSKAFTAVDYRRDRDHDRDNDRRHWRRGDYEKRGWHRFNRRPGDWRRRNCVAVGPVWFCP